MHAPQPAREEVRLQPVLRSFDGLKGPFQTRNAGDHDDLVQRDCDGEVLEIVLARALDEDGAVAIHYCAACF